MVWEFGGVWESLWWDDAIMMLIGSSLKRWMDECRLGRTWGSFVLWCVLAVRDNDLSIWTGTV